LAEEVDYPIILPVSSHDDRALLAREESEDCFPHTYTQWTTFVSVHENINYPIAGLYSIAFMLSSNLGWDNRSSKIQRLSVLKKEEVYTISTSSTRANKVMECPNAATGIYLDR